MPAEKQVSLPAPLGAKILHGLPAFASLGEKRVNGDETDEERETYGGLGKGKAMGLGFTARTQGRQFCTGLNTLRQWRFLPYRPNGGLHQTGRANDAGQSGFLARSIRDYGGLRPYQAQTVSAPRSEEASYAPGNAIAVPSRRRKNSGFTTQPRLAARVVGGRWNDRAIMPAPESSCRPRKLNGNQQAFLDRGGTRGSNE